jgi:nucleotidyltransferase substrate binding protein (TIGR01987 family)
MVESERGNVDIRWQQRYHNFSSAYELLREALEAKPLSEYSQLEQEGIAQRFEFTFELAWKLFKDYLEASGSQLVESTPRKVIKECAALGIFEAAGIEGEEFLEMLKARNLLSHIYGSQELARLLALIKESFLPQLTQEFRFFSGMVT